MRIGDTVKLKSRIQDPEKLDRFRLLNSYVAWRNSIRCSVAFPTNIEKAGIGYLEEKRRFDKKYNPTLYQKISSFFRE